MSAFLSTLAASAWAAGVSLVGLAAVIWPLERLFPARRDHAPFRARWWTALRVFGAPRPASRGAARRGDARRRRRHRSADPAGPARRLRRLAAAAAGGRGRDARRHLGLLVPSR